jgi:dihydroflavonol-4-reductase
MGNSIINKRPRIFLTGATGFIGKNIVEDLADDYEIRCLVRQSSDTSFLKRKGVKICTGDILEPSSFQPLRDEVVIHAAGRLGSAGDPWKVNVEGTKNLVRSLQGQRLIHISSAGVHGPGTGIDEQSPLNPSNRYERSKVAAEKIVKRYPNACILRPEFLYGPHDQHAFQLFDAIRKQRFFCIGDGSSTLHPTYIKDLIAVIREMIDSDFKGVRLVTGNRPVTVKELQKLIARASDTKETRIIIPRKAASLAAIPLQAICRAIGKEPPLTEERIRFFTESRSFDSGRGPTTIEEGIKETIRWNMTS